MEKSDLVREIDYCESLGNIRSQDLHGFFVGWPNPPSAETLFTILQNSEYFVIARDHETGKVVGFVNAISDKTLTVYIPLLEVIPTYQKLGIGSELVRRILTLTKNYYMTDLVCDSALTGFYRKIGFENTNAMSIRRYDHQGGSAI